MNPDDLKETWRSRTSQARLTIDAELLIRELRRNQRNFSAMILWRDIREVGTCLLMMPLWAYLGVRLELPWTWFSMLPVLAWMAGYLLADRIRAARQRAEPGGPLRRVVEGSLAEVEHQIRLLRDMLWWYLLPPAVPLLAFFVQVAWQFRAAGWAMAMVLAGLFAIAGLIAAGVLRANREAVRTELEPRRRELEELLSSLKDETPDPVGAPD